MKINKITVAIIIFLIALGVTSLAVWQNHRSAALSANAEWKKYENKKIGYAVLYPPTFIVYERAIPEDDYYESAIDDPAANERYFFTRSYGRQSDIDAVSSYFTGPYPKQIAPSGNLPNQTAVERTFNGMQGVEVYGRGAEGRGFDDQFFYIAYGRLWVISLDPVIEGHAAPDDIEPGMAAPTESYKQNYNSIWQGISISPTSVLSKEAALAQLRSDMQHVAAHFILPTWKQGQTLDTAEKEIERDVAALLAAQYVAEYPDNPIFNFVPGADFWLDAIGKRYILYTQAGADKSNDAILDSQTGQITLIPGNAPLYLAPGRNIALYVGPQSLYAYSLDQASSTLVAGSKLQGNETYHDGIGGLGTLVQAQETHTADNIIITVFDSGKVVPNPDGGTMYMRTGQKVLSF
jgi:hypothetical protein